VRIIIREIDTEEWKRRVQQEAIHGVMGGNTMVSTPIDTNAPLGFDLSLDVKIRTVTDARNNTGVAKRT
jgi:hypothetical protein